MLTWVLGELLGLFLESASSFVKKDIALAKVFLKMILGKSVGWPQLQLVEFDSFIEHFYPQTPKIVVHVDTNPSKRRETLLVWSNP